MVAFSFWAYLILRHCSLGTGGIVSVTLPRHTAQPISSLTPTLSCHRQPSPTSVWLSFACFGLQPHNMVLINGLAPHPAPWKTLGSVCVTATPSHVFCSWNPLPTTCDLYSRIVSLTLISQKAARPTAASTLNNHIKSSSLVSLTSGVLKNCSWFFFSFGQHWFSSCPLFCSFSIAQDLNGTSSRILLYFSPCLFCIVWVQVTALDA